jgi:hypothetical protein
MRIQKRIKRVNILKVNCMDPITSGGKMEKRRSMVGTSKENAMEDGSNIMKMENYT